MFDAQKFKACMARFASGITVLTWYEESAIQGITVSAFSSLSLNPPLVLFCIDHRAYVYPIISKRKSLCINILSANQTGLAYQFAGPDRSALEQHIYQHEEHQLPFIENAHANLVVQIRDSHSQGDHDIFIAEVIQARLPENTAPLLYHGGKIFHLDNNS